MKKYIFLMSFLLLCCSVYSENYISGYEYWMDDDYSGKTWVSTTGNPIIITTNEAIDASYLISGLHYFHLRFKDSDGRWSVTQSKSFLKGDINHYWSNLTNTLSGYEHWVDDGYSDRIGGDIISGASFTLTESIDFSSLGEGLHWYHIRFRDSEGNWGITQSKSFLIQDILNPWANNDNVLIEYEYWLDNNYAGKHGGPINSLKTFTLVAQIDFASIGEGLHHFHIRFKDSENKWSVAQSKLFVKPDLMEYWSKPDNKIISYSYWYDNDNTGSTDVTLPEPVNPYTLVARIDVPVFEANTSHTFSIKFQDTEGMWSPVRSNTFTINAIPIADAGPVELNVLLGEAGLLSGTASDPDGEPITQYEWSVLSAPANSGIMRVISSLESFSFTPDVAGDFILSFRAYGGNAWSEPDQITVHCITNRPPLAKCKDVTVEANTEGCSAITTIDDGSYDPDGDQVNIVLDPAPPYHVGTTEVTLTITDPLGESATCMANVTVEPLNPTPVISVDPEYTVTGEAGNTIYLGYGAQSVTLTASGGSEYEWSSVPSGTYQSNSSIVVSPTTSTTYTVLVTNDIGCSASASVVIYVYDWRCGKDLRKVKVCHNGKEICIDENAVQAHLDHGDKLGNCRMTKENMSDEEYNYSSTDELSVQLKQNYPNPFAQLTEIQYFVSQREHATLLLTDINGRVVANLIDKYVSPGWNTLIVNGSGLNAGTYILRLECMGKAAMMKIVKME